MTQPTQLVISEQARDLAVIIVTSTHIGVEEAAVRIERLLNSQREAIIRECAEEVGTHWNDLWTTVNQKEQAERSKGILMAKTLNKHE